jgi:hypothetical protein
MKAVIVFLASTCSAAAFAQSASSDVKHVVVFHEKGRFAGWPANHGIWSWGDEILVGFEVGSFRQTERGHAIDYERPAEHVLARSLDGGETWRIERPEGLRPPPGEEVAGVPTGAEGRPLRDCPGGIDFSHPDFIFTARMTSIHAGQSRFHYSMDRGKTWEGPFRLPDFGQPGTAARTDYLINGRHEMTLFLTAAKSNGREGTVICVRTRDGGKTWTLESFVTPEPEGDEYAIMPSSIRLSDGSILTLVRYRRFIDSYLSKDDGKTWSHTGRPVSELGGGPPSLLKLKDGRLALLYAYRLEPYGLRAKLSSDEGLTWSDPVVLRDDGGNWDLGYPRTVQRSDGKLVSVYYYNTDPNSERFIGGTIWTPPPPGR